MSPILTRRAMATLLALPALFTARRFHAHTTLLSALGDRRAAAVVGHLALGAMPEMGNVQVIADGIWESLAMDRNSDAADIRARLSSVIREDFTAERTLRVEGWLVSETEARLCALAALTA
jgi:glycosyltransferase A (GT-A) superfamily protein (DUF2064 family)